MKGLVIDYSVSRPLSYRYSHSSFSTDTLYYYHVEHRPLQLLV